MGILRLRRRRLLALAAAFCFFVLSGCGDPVAENAGERKLADDAALPTSEAEATETATVAPDPDVSDVVQGDQDDTTEAMPEATAAVQPTATSEPTPMPEPTVVVRVQAPNGRSAPAVATTPAELATQLIAAEAGLADPSSTALQRSDWGHLHQVAIRKLGYAPDWDVEVFEALPQDLRPRTLLHVSARRALIDLSSGYSAADFIPAWEIVEPEPAASLLEHYRAAEAATGIEWEYLAAINLVETGMGRIRGLSSAGAQGPMQFLPTTWAEAGIGEGDINDPADAIAGAARYLVRRGGPGDMAGAIWGYNNSDNYVTAVQAYAEVLRQDPLAYEAIYNWEIYFFTEAGDVWLPTGFVNEETIDLRDFLAANPWSLPDEGLRAREGG